MERAADIVGHRLYDASDVFVYCGISAGAGVLLGTALTIGMQLVIALG